jgi:hypothetical protein
MFKEPTGKKMPSSKSLNELINLLMKLNEKIREKITRPSKSKKDTRANKTDVVIIIMTNEEEKAHSTKTSRSAKAEPVKADWIQGLCEEIEKGHPTPKRP